MCYVLFDVDVFEMKYVFGCCLVIFMDVLSDESDFVGVNMWINVFLRDACGGDALMLCVELCDEGVNEWFG